MIFWAYAANVLLILFCFQFVISIVSKEENVGVNLFILFPISYFLIYENIISWARDKNYFDISHSEFWMYFYNDDVIRNSFYGIVGIMAVFGVLAVLIGFFGLKEQRKEELAIQAKEKEEEEHQTFVRRMREIEQAKAEGMAQGLILQYQAQLAILAEHKRQGLDIEKEALDLREKMIALEREENNEFMTDMLDMIDKMTGTRK